MERAATRNVAAAENELLTLSTYTVLFTDPHIPISQYINVLYCIVLNCSVNLVFTGLTAIRTFPARVLVLRVLYPCDKALDPRVRLLV